MSTPETLVRARAVRVEFGGRAVLDGVDINLRSGEVLTVVGLNGSGKSTLVRVVVGLQRVQQGSVWRRPSLRIGYTPQQLSPDPRLPISVERFVALGGRASMHRVAEVLDEVGAGAVARTQLADVSGGELHRVLLARALLLRPELLVLDEPMAGVDLAGRSELYRLIGDLRNRYGCGVMMVSHDLHVVMAGTDTVLCLNHHVCCSGPAHSIARDPQFIALFGSDMADVLAVYSHHHDHTHDVHGDTIPLPEHGDHVHSHREHA